MRRVNGVEGGVSYTSPSNTAPPTICAYGRMTFTASELVYPQLKKGD